MSLLLVDQLLRDRNTMHARIDRGERLDRVWIAMVLTIAVCAALTGAAIGSYRGGLQIVYAAVKLPIVLLGSAALCATTLTALNAALGRPACFARDLARMLVAMAFGALVLLAEAPLFLVASSLDLSYHKTTLLMVGCLAVSGCAAVSVLSTAVRLTAVRDASGVLLSVLLVFALVGSQLAWTLRPYLLRPRASEVVFIRDLEGSLYDAVLQTARSARGRYDPPLFHDWQQQEREVRE